MNSGHHLVDAAYGWLAAIGFAVVSMQDAPTWKWIVGIAGAALVITGSVSAAILAFAINQHLDHERGVDALQDNRLQLHSAELRDRGQDVGELKGDMKVLLTEMKRLSEDMKDMRSDLKSQRK